MTRVETFIDVPLNQKEELEQEYEAAGASAVWGFLQKSGLWTVVAVFTQGAGDA